MKSHVFLLALFIIAACRSPSPVAHNRSIEASRRHTDSLQQVMDSIQRIYAPVDSILQAYGAKRISADSAVRALGAFQTKMHLDLNIEMDSAMRAALVRLHNGRFGHNR